MKLQSGLLVAALAWLLGGSAVVSAQIQFDRPKTEPPLENPYTIAAQRSEILKTVREVLKTCSIPLDEQLSREAEGKLVTKYVTFTRGVTAQTDLQHYSNLPAGEVRNWTQGRFALEITALPLDEKRSQLQVMARIQGRVADFSTGGKWVDASSNGRLEDEILRGLAGKILGLDLGLKKGSNLRRILSCEY
jgi:hypothetical protein